MRLLPLFHARLKCESHIHIISYCSCAPYSLACAANRNLIFLLDYLFVLQFSSRSCLGEWGLFFTPVDSLNYCSKKNLSSSYKLYAPTSVSKKPISRIFLEYSYFTLLETVIMKKISGADWNGKLVESRKDKTKTWF